MSLTIAGLRTRSVARSLTIAHVRYVASSQRGAGTAQSVDKVLEDQRRQARLAPGMDPTSQTLSLLQPIVEPKLTVGKLLAAGPKATFWYFIARIRRYILTRSSLKTIDRLDHVRDDLKMSERFLSWFPRQYHQYRARELISQAFEQYLAYNKAQASGDINALRQVAKGTAFELARKRFKDRQPGDQLDWQLLKITKRPRLLNAAAMQLTDEVYGAQIIVAFDTEQALTYKPKGRVPQTRSSRVQEFYVLERLLPGFGQKWKLRDQIHEDNPFDPKRLEAGK